MSDPITAIVTATTIIDGTSAFITAVAALLTKVAASSLSVFGAAATIAKFMPPPDGDSKWARIHKWINKLGMNSGYAANSPAEPTQQN